MSYPDPKPRVATAYSELGLITSILIQANATQACSQASLVGTSS